MSCCAVQCSPIVLQYFATWHNTSCCPTMLLGDHSHFTIEEWNRVTSSSKLHSSGTRIYTRFTDSSFFWRERWRVGSGFGSRDCWLTLLVSFPVWLFIRSSLLAFLSLVLLCDHFAITIDLEIFAIKNFSPVAYAVKIKHAKINTRIRATLRNYRVAKYF